MPRKNYHRKRNPLARIALKSANFLTITEMSQLLRVRKKTIRHWLGYGVRTKWRLPGFPEPEMRNRRISFPLFKVEKFFKLRLSQQDRATEIILPLLTIDDVSQLAGRSQSTVRRWIREEGLRAVKIGHKGLIRIQRRDLEDFLSEKFDYGVIDRYRNRTCLHCQKFW